MHNFCSIQRKELSANTNMTGKKHFKNLIVNAILFMCEHSFSVQKTTENKRINSTIYKEI